VKKKEEKRACLASAVRSSWLEKKEKRKKEAIVQGTL
jgi:hypothetical protein